MSSIGVSSCTLFDEDCLCMKGFNISFSWDYPDNWCLKDVKDTVFHLLDANDPSKCDYVTLIKSIQSADMEVVLTQPNPEQDVIPCELHLKAHPDSLQFCITDILVISEAKHIELYVNDMYGKTFKGCVLNLKKGKKPAVYETQLDLSAHIQGTQKISLKFLSLPDKRSMKLQAVALTIVECTNSLPTKTFNGTDMPTVRELLKSMKLGVNDSAEKLMMDIEMHQQQNQLLQFQSFLQAGNIIPQQIYNMAQPSHVENIASQIPQLKNLMVQSNGISQPFQNVISSQIPGNNRTFQSTPVMKNIPNGDSYNPSRADVDYSSSQNNSIVTSNPHDFCHKVISRSCPGSLDRSPTSRCVRASNHLPACSTADVNGRCSCALQQSCINCNNFNSTNLVNESVLANAILNEEPSRKYTKNRNSMIDHENLHEVRALQNECRNSVHSDPATNGVRLRHPDSISRRCLADRKRKARSLCSMPTDSEQDFSQLLTEIITDESKDSQVKIHVDDGGSDPNVSARWESYLRSRVRASQRYSTGLNSSNDSDALDRTREHQDYDSVIEEISQCNNQDIPRCKKCGCSGCHNVYKTLSRNIISMEQKLVSQIESKIEDLRRHLDKRIYHILEVMNIPETYDYDENLCSNTEV